MEGVLNRAQATAKRGTLWVALKPRTRLIVGEDKMYHGTCRERRFIKRIQEGVVAIIQFKESGGHNLVFENSDEEFRD